MEVNLRLCGNRSFNWNTLKENMWKGYEMQTLQNFIEKIGDIQAGDFDNQLKALNGCFSIVLNTKEEIILIADRFKTFQLFYSVEPKTNKFFISDDCYWMSEAIFGTKKLENENLNETALHQLIKYGYIIGNDTLVKGVREVQAGEKVVINKETGQVRNLIYGKHYYEKIQRSTTEAELFCGLQEIAVDVFTRLVESLEGKTIVLPLSGGYDSRFIAVMLKRINYPKVICYTYGKKASKEVAVSKSVAKQLGYEWNFIEYTDNLCDEFTREDYIKEYMAYASNLCSLPLVQDVFAVKALKDRGMIPSDAVFVPGHVGDSLAGGTFLKRYAEVLHSHRKRRVTLQIFSEALLHKYFMQYEGQEVNQNDILQLNEMISLHGKENCIELKITQNDLVEQFFHSTRNAKYIINSDRAYEFFGYEWRIPLADNAFLEFWHKMPYEYRQDGYLYEKFLMDYIFRKYNIDFRKEWNFKKMAITMLKRILPEKYKCFLLDLRKRLNPNKYNGYGFDEFAEGLYASLQHPEVFEERRNFRHRDSYVTAWFYENILNK